MNTAFKDVDSYIKSFPEDVQLLLNKMRTIFSNAAPDAEEGIKYGIPTIMKNGNIAHFGGYKDHIGFYPAPRAIEAFKDELAKYEGAKGTVQFPLDKPLPVKLIERMIKYRIKEMDKKNNNNKQMKT